MKRFSLSSLLLSLVVVSGAISASGQSETLDSDFQVWNETTLAFPIIKKLDKDGKESDKLSILVFGTLRLGQNRLFPVDGRIGAGIDVSVNKFLSLSPTYLYRRATPQRNSKEYEHRFRFDATLSHSWKHFALKDRNRVEYRVRNSRSDSVRYRNKFTFSVPVKYKDKEIFTPFIAEEIFYDFSEKELSQNELSIGFTRKINSNASAEIFYLRRDTKGGDIRFINAIGANLKFRID